MLSASPSEADKLQQSSDCEASSGVPNRTAAATAAVALTGFAKIVVVVVELN